jgi:hypothetical protein
MTVHEFKPLISKAEPAPPPQAANGSKLVSALLSWWRYRVRPPIVPAHLRGDIGLPPEPDTSNYDGVPIIKPLLLALWRA